MILDMLNKTELEYLTSLGFAFDPKEPISDDMLEELFEKCVEIEISYAQDQEEKGLYYKNEKAQIAVSIVTKISTHPDW